jgi:hypothetical protein
MITVGATVIAVFPLAAHGGPLVGAALLRPDWRTHRRDICHVAASARVLRDLGARLEDRKVGNTALPSASQLG